MNGLRHIVVIIFMSATPLVFMEHARAVLIFDRAASQKITTDGAFKEGANLDPNFLLVGSGAETIEGGAEGELQASSAIPSAGQRRGELVDVVDRKFAVTDRPEDLVYTLLMSGTWTGLRTSDVEGAFYNLFILYTDEVFEIVDDRMIRRAILSGDNTESGRRNQAPKSENISLDKSQPLRLLQGDYLLRSTVTYTASYERAGWILNLRDQIFGPQGVGSGGDMRGFQSRLTPPEVLPPPTPIPEPSTIWLVSLSAFLLLSSSRGSVRRLYCVIRLPRKCPVAMS